MQLWLSPPYAGKSYLSKMKAAILLPPVNRHRTSVQGLTFSPLIDGDKVIAAADGWPPGEWWRNPLEAQLVHRLHANMLRAYLRKHKAEPGVVLFWTDPVSWIDPEKLIDRIWIPKDYFVNLPSRMRRRRLQQPDRPVVTVSDVEESLARVLNWARSSHTPLSISRAVVPARAATDS